MKQVATQFEEFLRTKNLRFTKQRAAILKAIYGTHRHVSADQLYALLHKGGQAAELDISRATVYRTLALLAEGGFVQALDLGRDTGALYEHTLGHEHHDHMICLLCGRIIEFSDSRLEQIQEEAVRKHGFHAQSHRLNVFGTCDRCARREGPAPATPEGTASPGADTPGADTPGADTTGADTTGEDTTGEDTGADTGDDTGAASRSEQAGA